MFAGKSFLIVLVLMMCACGADHDFKKARGLEDQEKYTEAARVFERFLEDHPDDPRAAEAAYRAGRLHAEIFGKCEQAQPLFEQAARSGTPEPGSWPERARLALITCPGFFPLTSGRSWTYGDTMSGGEYMKLEVKVRDSSGSVSATIAGTMFAGENKIDYRRKYLIKDWSLWEDNGTANTPILKFPYIADRSWSVSREDQTTALQVVGKDLVVATKAGRFTGCIKIKTHITAFESWTYDYYCPGVGRVKTTVGASGVENPNTELISYRTPKAF